MIPVLSSSRPCVTAHSQHVPHNRCHTRGARIVGEFVDAEIVGPIVGASGCAIASPLTPARIADFHPLIRPVMSEPT